MKPRWFLSLFLSLIFSTCSSPPESVPTPTLPPREPNAPLALATAGAPFPPPTLPPTTSPVPTHRVDPWPFGTVTPSVPVAWSPDEKPIECRKGPDPAFAPVKTFQAAEIVGQDRSRVWWYLKIDANQGRADYCWVAEAAVRVHGELAALPVVEAEAASLTEVTISLSGVATQTIQCEPQAEKPVFNLIGEIRANGPLKQVRASWETADGQMFPVEPRAILAWDVPVTFEQSLSLPSKAGTYALTLRAQSPNEIVAVVQVTVQCQ